MFQGAYSASRAAALAGVPKSTVHYWARRGIVVPSVSPTKVKLWSYGDLLCLRTIYWLRHDKRTADGRRVPATSMDKIRRALQHLRKLEAELFEGVRPALSVTTDGKVLLQPAGHPAQWSGSDGQLVLAGALDLIAPFKSAEGPVGPDLVEPAPWVRIHPGRLAGAPHVRDTRIETEALFTLSLRGFEIEGIHRLYPEISPEAVRDAVLVEEQLARNALPRAA
jgi:uncharacterized protein (DUF433 family)/DNA-binding transcriptional MerR regulator